MVEIIHHADASELIELAGTCLEAHESENNLPIGLAYALAKDPLRYGPEPPLLLSVLEQGSPIGGAVMTPPRRIILSKFIANTKEAMAHLVRYLLANGCHPSLALSGRRPQRKPFLLVGPRPCLAHRRLGRPCGCAYLRRERSPTCPLLRGRCAWPAWTTFRSWRSGWPPFRKRR